MDHRARHHGGALRLITNSLPDLREGEEVVVSIERHRSDKTREDVATKAKIERVRKKHLGISKPKQKIPYRRLNGDQVWPK